MEITGSGSNLDILITSHAMPTQIEFKKYPTGEDAYLDSLSRNKISNQDIQDIINTCQQENLYYWLFKIDLASKPYTKETADFWVDKKATHGWDMGSAYTYVIRNSEDRIVGAVDIKADSIEGAEIGYWADENQPGYTTNALLALINSAKKAGYTKIFALVSKGNQRSCAVLERAGFTLTNDNYDCKGEICDYYEVNLGDYN